MNAQRREFSTMVAVLFHAGAMHSSRATCKLRLSGEPVAAMLKGRTVLLDPVGAANRTFFGLVSALGLAR